MRSDTQAALLALVVLAAGIHQATADVADAAPAPASSWVYDRLSWNPGGDTLAVQAFPDSPGGVTPARQLLVPTDLSAQVTVAPDVRAVQVSSSGDAALLLGDQGLWWFEPATGRLVQIHFQPPASTERLCDFAFRREGAGAAFLTGAAGDRRGGFYRWVPGEPVTRLAARKTGSTPPPEWPNETLPPTEPNVTGMRSARRLTVPGSPPIVLDYDGRQLVINTGYEGSRAELDDVTVAWAAWPSAGGRLLVSVEDQAGDGARLYEATAGDAIRQMFSSRVLPGGWLNDREALVHSADGKLYRYQADLDSLVVIELDNPPGWASDPAPEARVATLAVSRWPRSARKFENQQNLVRSCAARLPEALRDGALVFGRRMNGEGQLVGVFPSIEDAAAAAPTFEASGMSVTPVLAEARVMSGSFDYGSTRSVLGDRAWIRRLDQAGGGAEIWVERVGQPPLRLLTREITR